MESAGKKFRSAMGTENPLQLIGTVNAFVAIMAKEAGYRAIYLSGAGIANNSYGLPDLGVTTLDDVLEDVRRITDVVDLPLIVDIDTGWENSLMVARAIKAMIKAGAAGVHIEDQVTEKRCGHRPNKRLVSIDNMNDRIKAAVDAKTDPDFIIIARSDAFAQDRMEGLIERCEAYKAQGADMLFPEALKSLEQFKMLKSLIKAPILANLTEFGSTPLLTLEQLRETGIEVALYPLTISRIMNQAAEQALKEIREKGTQQLILGKMQTRERLYHYLNYYTYEREIDEHA
jgi:methylisocitrate lyase